MQYCIFRYEVTYEDGDGIHGYVPYRGENTDEKTLIRFIKKYFAGTKPYHDEDIHVTIEKFYDDPKEWITEVRTWETFRYLQNVNNYGGELIAKYFPDEFPRK